MVEKSHLEFLAQQLHARRNTVADARQKLNGRQIGADRAPISNAQIKHVRQTVLFDMCRFMLEDNSSAASFETSLAQKFLARPPFRRWLEQASCLEIYNRIYIKDARISALFGRQLFQTQNANTVLLLQPSAVGSAEYRGVSLCFCT
jgi:hypothetical protein